MRIALVFSVLVALVAMVIEAVVAGPIGAGAAVGILYGICAALAGDTYLAARLLDLLEGSGRSSTAEAVSATTDNLTETKGTVRI